MSKFTEKLKTLSKKLKVSAKKNPKLFGTVLALIVVASGGSAATATGIIEIAAILDASGQLVNSMTGAE